MSDCRFFLSVITHILCQALFASILEKLYHEKNKHDI